MYYRITVQCTTRWLWRGGVCYLYQLKFIITGPFIRSRAREVVNSETYQLVTYSGCLQQYFKPDLNTLTLLQQTSKSQESREVRGDKTGHLLPDLASINTLKSERAPLLLVLFDVSALRLGPAQHPLSLNGHQTPLTALLMVLMVGQHKAGALAAEQTNT